MHKNQVPFQLNFYRSFPDVKAVSGIVYKDSKLYFISDDSEVLYCFHRKSEDLIKISLRTDGKILEHIPKPDKPDFECITYFDDSFYIFGSGSTAKRNKLVIVDGRNLSLKVHQMDDFYNRLKKAAAIDEANFNIEGCFCMGNVLYLFNRGNGVKKQNGIFRIENWKNTEIEQIKYFPVSLSHIDEIQFTFTDAIAVEDKIYFLAAAEDSASTYADGEISGSLLGRMDMETLKLEETLNISRHHKFEGLTLMEHADNSKTFVICDDPDNDQEISRFYLLEVDNF